MSVISEVCAVGLGPKWARIQEATHAHTKKQKPLPIGDYFFFFLPHHYRSRPQQPKTQVSLTTKLLSAAVRCGAALACLPLVSTCHWEGGGLLARATNWPDHRKLFPCKPKRERKRKNRDTAFKLVSVFSFFFGSKQRWTRNRTVPPATT